MNRLILKVWLFIDHLLLRKLILSSMCETLAKTRSLLQCDGANDVNMIESAHVGIGIMGKEGN